MKKYLHGLFILSLLIGPLLIQSTQTAHASSTYAPQLANNAERIDVFTDSLNSAFQATTWNAAAQIENGEWKLDITAGWGNLHAFSAEPISGVTQIVFSARGTGQSEAERTIDFDFFSDDFQSGTLSVGLSTEMQAFTFDHDGTPFNSLHWSDHLGNGTPTVYIDEVYLIVDTNPAQVPTTAPTGNAEVSLTVDPSVDLGPIDPYVYGINFPDEGLAAELDLPINRWGGNTTSVYNWRESIWNLGSDWFFLNYTAGEEYGADLDNLPAKSGSNLFIEQNLRTETDTLLTIPMIGWTAKRGEIECSFRVSVYGPQDATEEPFRPDCGNGLANGQYLYGQSPEDNYVAVDENDAKAWLNDIKARYGDQAVEFVALDNEPMLWNSTHRDVYPNGAGYDDVRDLALQYAPAIKEVLPNAKTLGPVAWGWTAYEYSAKDLTDGGPDFYLNPPDRNAHDDKPFLEWYLEEMAAYENQTGQRVLDYLDIHYYPQAENTSLSSVVSLEAQQVRLRSTRSLWDATYKDESWINENVQLIPRMKQLIAENYPGTKLALTEYEWGAQGHINGALAQADILGIFGREGIDMALLWATPKPSDPISYAFRLYRNYDGQGSKFGDRSIRATSTDQDKVSVYAATHSDGATTDGAITIVLVNKSLDDIEVDLGITNNSGVAEVYQYSPQNLNAIERLANRTLAADASSNTFIMPKNSIQMLVLDSDASEPPQSTPTPTPIDPTPTPTPVPPTSVPSAAGITVQLFIDTNENGIFDSGEEPLAGVTVSVSDSTNGAGVTDPNGQYTFPTNGTESYTIIIPIPAGVVSNNRSEIRLGSLENGDEAVDFTVINAPSNDGTSTTPDASEPMIRLPLIFR